MDKIPADWAIKESLKRTELSCSEVVIKACKTSPSGFKLTLELAKMIEKYEQPPVDPDILLCREICALYREETGTPTFASEVRQGIYDSGHSMGMAMFMLKLFREKYKCQI